MPYKKAGRGNGSADEYDDGDGGDVVSEEIEERTEVVDTDGNPLPTSRHGNRVVVFMKQHSGKWWWIAGCFVVFILIMIFVYWAAFDQYQWNNNYHVHQIDQKLADKEMGRGGLTVARSSLYSLVSVLDGRRAYTLALCHRASYDPGKRGNLDVFTRSDMAARAQAMALGQAQSLPKNILLDTRLEMRYNVEVSADVLRQNGLSPTQRYQTLHYEVSSNYDRFSTIKLLVSSEDIYKQVPRVRQEVVICSNRPDSERRCSHSVSLGSKLLMNNTLLFEMESSVQPPQVTEGASAQSEETTQPQRGINLVDNDQENLRGLELGLANNRQFHILFYKELTTSTTSRDNSGDDYTEYIALTVEPAEC